MRHCSVSMRSNFLSYFAVVAALRGEASQHFLKPTQIGMRYSYECLFAFLPMYDGKWRSDPIGVDLNIAFITWQGCPKPWS